jgi:hypothetical protein
MPQSHGVDAKTIERDGQTRYRKEGCDWPLSGILRRNHFSRHLYQNYRWRGGRPPYWRNFRGQFWQRYATVGRGAQFKTGAMVPGEVAKDLPEHGLQLSAGFTRNIVQQVGKLQRADPQEAWRRGHIQQMANRVCPQTDQ